MKVKEADVDEPRGEPVDEPAVDKPDPTDSAAEASSKTKPSEADTDKQADDESSGKRVEKAPRRLRLSVSLRSLVVGLVITVLVAAVGVLAWLYVGAENKLDAQARQAENNSHAEKVALDYAVNAAAMDFNDLNAWKVKLVEGTSPELKEKLSRAAKEMEQILVPLEWTSTARPLAAKVRSVAGDVFVVDSFVSVQTKTIQSPEPLQSTATYSVTVDGNNGWLITDVGGIGAVVEQK
jgi:hypothetical protein